MSNMRFSAGVLSRVLRPSSGRSLSGRPLGVCFFTRGLSAQARVNSGPRLFATKLETRKDDLILKKDDLDNPQGQPLSRLWLRDNCRCAQCINQDTMQRAYDTFEIPTDIKVQELTSKAEGVDITWSDAHKSHYSWAWLNSVFQSRADKTPLTTKQGRRLWSRSIGTNPPEVEYDYVMDKSSARGMAELTNNLRIFGFCFVTDSPKTPEDTKKLLESIGPIRNTHYGGFYDFIPDLALADTAYTNIALPAHTDTTYFSEPAGLQAFHLLSHSPPPGKSAEETLGGKSLLVDGFYAAYLLRKETQLDYHVLRNVKLPWHASGNEDVAIAPDQAYPVLEASTHQVFRVRWNNDDRGVVPIGPNAAPWYEAARKWNDILKRKANEYWFQLEPGRILIFDNWRVLHGRSAFEGTRRICGGYINRDDFISRWKLSNFPREEVIATNMQLR